MLVLLTMDTRAYIFFCFLAHVTYPQSLSMVGTLSWLELGMCFSDALLAWGPRMPGGRAALLSVLARSHCGPVAPRADAR